MNILHVTPDFNYACGRSYYVYLLLKYFNRDRNKSFLATNGGDSFERINELRIPYFIVKSLKSKNPVSLANSIKQIRELIIKNNIDIVHTHHRYAELISVHAKKLLPRNKKPLTVHTALSIVKRKYIIEFSSDKIIAVSGSVYEMLVKRFGVRKEKIEMIPNFIDTDETYKTIGSKRKKGRYYSILSIGRFHHEKNFETLLKALNILKNENIKLVLVGEGDKYIDYKTYINKHKLNVEIVEPQKNLVKYFWGSDVCILPSIRDPFPNFMLQSGLHRKPFIGANVDGIAELIINGHNGLLFKSGNYEELAEKIMIFKSNRKLAETCAHNLYANVIHNYTQENIIPKIFALYEQLLSR